MQEGCAKEFSFPFAGSKIFQRCKSVKKAAQPSFPCFPQIAQRLPFIFFSDANYWHE
jgi:hypothetical protein